MTNRVSLAEAERLEQKQSVPVTAESEAAEIARLSGLPLLAYEKERPAAAARLGVRAAVLDKIVVAEHAQEDAGSTVLFPDTEPWPEPVNGADILSAIAGVLDRYVVLPAGGAEAVALWVLHAHAHDASRISPILAITSPTPECGKTTLLTVLSGLVPKALPASNITAAALFRAVEKWRPTLLVDEADTFLRNSDELRGVINSGHNRGAAYVIRTTGDDHEPTRFSTWSPKCIALIGKLQATLASRAIHIELRRMAPNESRDEARADRLQHLAPLAQQAARWVQDKSAELRAADPELPEKLKGRRADNWRTLLAIADVAGGGWPARASQAAEALSVDGEGDTAQIMLLADIRDIFDADGIDKIPSSELADKLVAMEHRPWPEWSKGKPISPRQIARILSAFSISPASIRTNTGTPKGYRKEQFEDDFARYLPSNPPHRHNPQETAENRQFLSATPVSNVADENGQKPWESATCGGVADKHPQHWKGEV